MSDHSLSLYERFRPQEFAQVVGQDKVIARLLDLQARGGLSGRAYWIAGQSGTGKTTIARLIADATAERWATTEFSDPSELTADRIEDIRSCSRLRPLGRGYCFILNEAHGCSNALVRKLLGLTESIPNWLTWVFTTTIEGQDSLFEDCDDNSPLLSRCLQLPLARRGLAEAFAARCQAIAESEALGGRPPEDYLRLLKDNRNNMRAALQAIENGDMRAAA